jgi:hypothetical protein
MRFEGGDHRTIGALGDGRVEALDFRVRPGMTDYGGVLTAFVSIVIPGSMTSVFSTLNPTSRKMRST